MRKRCGRSANSGRSVVVVAAAGPMIMKEAVVNGRRAPAA